MKTKMIVTFSIFTSFSALLLAFASISAYADEGEDEELFVFPPGFYEADYFGPPRGEDSPRGPVNEEGQFSYIIRIDEVGLIDEQESRGVLLSGQRYIKDDPTSLVYKQQLSEQIKTYISIISQQIGRELVVTHYYLALDPGFSAWFYEEEAELVKGIPWVVKVQRVHYEYPQSYRSPGFIGADEIWSGDATPPGVEGARGEGVVIAVLDHGINPDHPVVQNDPSCDHGSAGKPSKLISYVDCTEVDDSGLCIGSNPEDFKGHGTAVAHIATGIPTGSLADPPPEPPDPYTQISGVAPCAHIRSYKICDQSGCPINALDAAMLQMLDLDNDVDILNYSISGGRKPWEDSDRRKLDAVNRGIVVVSPAGNKGSRFDSGDIDDGKVQHRGPWVTTVGASTHDGEYGGVTMPGDFLSDSSLRGPTPEPFENLTKPDLAAPGVYVYTGFVGGLLKPEPSCGQSCDVGEIRMTRGNRSPVGEELTNMPIRYYADDPYGCDVPAGAFADAVAVVREGGECSLRDRIQNVWLAGARLVTVVFDEDYPVPGFDSGIQPPIPAYGMDGATGDELIDVLENHGDLMGDFDPKAPYYQYVSGTSFAAPHVAGAAALIKQVHPDWTPSEIKSALMMTSSPHGFKEGNTFKLTPWDFDDVGSGRVDLTQAALAGLVMDESTENYLAANPKSGGDVRKLNLPSVRDMDCTPACTFQRTVRNTLDVPTEWTVLTSEITEGVRVEVEPETFTFDGSVGETQELEITVQPLAELLEEVAFAEIVFRATGQLPDQRLTVSLKGKETEFGGFVFQYDGIQGVSDPFFVLEPRGGGRLQPWAYKPEDVFPDNPDGLSFVEDEEYYEPFAPDGLKVGNIDWQGLGTGKIITWDADGHRYNHTSSGTTIYFRGRELCNILWGTGRIAGAAIREISGDTYKLGVIAYGDDRTFHYLERNWHPNIQYENDGPYDTDDNPDGWLLVHSAQHEYAPGFWLRSGMFFSDDGDKAVGLLRGSQHDADVKPWSEAHFNLNAGFSFNYFQIGYYWYDQVGNETKQCTLGDVGLNLECGDSDSYSTTSSQSLTVSEVVSFDSGFLEPAGEDFPWATLSDQITLAIDYSGNAVTRLEIAHVEFNAIALNVQASASGEYDGNANTTCDDDDKLIQQSVSRSGSNTISASASEEIYHRSGYLLDGVEIYDRNSYVRGNSRSMSGSGSGNYDRVTNCSPPGENCETVDTGSYGAGATGTSFYYDSNPASSLLFADLRDKVVVFIDCEVDSQAIWFSESDGETGSAIGELTETEGYSSVLYSDGLITGLYSFSETLVEPLESSTPGSGMNTGSVTGLMGLYSTGSIFGIGGLSCSNSSDDYDVGGNWVPVLEGEPWRRCTSGGGIEFVHYAKYGSRSAYLILTSPDTDDTQTAVLYFNVDGRQYGQVIAFPGDTQVDFDTLSVL